MIDFQLLDGQILEAAREGDLTVVAWVVGILALGFVLGFVAWLKGRKWAAIIVLTLLVAAIVMALIPEAWISDRFAIDTSMATWVMIGIVGAAFVVGLVAASRLARPPSWWAQRRYDNDTYAEAIERHHWTRVKPR